MHAPLFLSLFDTHFPATERVSPHRRSFRPQAANTPPHLPGEVLPSVAKLHERLALLAKLELPCTILVTNPRLYLRHALIRAVDMADGNLSIVGDDFDLRLRGDMIQAIRLVNDQEGSDGGGSLDIYHPHGMLYASIRPVLDGTAGAVWRDVMDNPSLSLC